MTIKVVYQDGVFKPLKPLDVQEGTEAEVTIQKPRSIPTPEKVIESLLRLADMPLEGGGKPFSGQDHDKVLYGDPHQT